MDASQLEPLDWDDQEAATIPSVRPLPHSNVRRSSKGWLIITNEWAANEEVTDNAPASSIPPTTASPITQPRDHVMELTDFEIEIEDEPCTRPSPASAPQSLSPPELRRHSEIRPVSAPLPLVHDVIGERETRQRLSSINFEVITEPLEKQITQLRRWLMVSLVLATVATISAAVAVVYALGGPSAVFPSFEVPRFGGGSATMANNPRVVGTRITGHAPVVAATAVEPVIGRAPVDAVPSDGKVAVTIAFVGGRASITLTQFGSNQRMVNGPFPTTLRLEPGRYTLTAYRPGAPIFQRQLDLDLASPNREVAIRFD